MPLLSGLIPQDHQRNSKISFDVAPAQADHAPSVKSCGVLGQMAGSRADEVIADDVEVPNNSFTQPMRDKLAEAVKEFDAILKPNGKLFIVEPHPFILWKTLSVIAEILSYFAIPNCKNIHAVLSSEDELLKNFSKNRKALQNIISQKYHQVCSKWHTGFWIFGGMKQ